MVEAKRQRILLVTRNLPPLVGGMERLNWHMVAELAKTAEVRVIGPVGSAALAPGGVLVREVPLKPLWRFLLAARGAALREARQWKPDVVLAGSGLTAPIALAAARCAKASSAVYVHGLDVAVKHPVYRAVWLRAIRAADRVIANSRATAKLCRDIGVCGERMAIVHPGVDLPAMDEGAGAAFRAERNLGNRPLLLSVGRLSTRKGLREFVTRALPHIVAARPDVLLLIVGDAPAQALHATAQSRESIQAAADAAGVGTNLQFLGVITDYGELGRVYRAADVHVFPVRELPGDPEGFGMVAVEAAAHDLPTVAFATGGIVDAVAEGASGYLVVAGDYHALASTVGRALSERDHLRVTCIEFARGFVWPEFGRQLKSNLASPMNLHGPVSR